MTTTEKMLCVAAVAVTALVLSGCTPVQTLDTPELRAGALQEELTQVADAVASFDASAIEELQCEEPRYIELPREDQLDEAVSLPLSIEMGEAEPLDLSDSQYTDPDPAAEFHLASIRQASRGGAGARVSLPDVIVRVDDRRACVWAIGPRFALLLGL
ncbi:hypothetical protein [Microbacterium alcoholitolerans]|uniref:hypothetical protein n=1 Tax=unclassified Microbacterium TaxID=2609290 RepID=UPI003D174440